MRRILLIEDELIVAMDVKRSLEKDGETSVISARNYKEAKAAFLNGDFDTIICDINLNDIKDGIEIIWELNQIKEVPVVYLTAYDTAEVLNRAKQTVPYAYLLKPFNELQLKMTLDLADLNYKKKQGGQTPDIENNKKLEELTSREKEVLVLITTGKTSKEIGGGLHISFHTVDKHKKNIKKKLDLRTTAELINFALSTNIKFAF